MSFDYKKYKNVELIKKKSSMKFKDNCISM